MSNTMDSIVFAVPPLSFTDEQQDEGVAIIEQALEVADEAVATGR